MVKLLNKFQEIYNLEMARNPNPLAPDDYDRTPITRLLNAPEVASIANELRDLVRGDEAGLSEALRILRDSAGSPIARELIVYVISTEDVDILSEASRTLLHVAKHGDAPDLRFAAITALRLGYVFEGRTDDDPFRENVFAGPKFSSFLSSPEIVRLFVDILSNNQEAPRMRYQAVLGIAAMDIPILRRFAKTISLLEPNHEIKRAARLIELGITRGWNDDSWENPDALAKQALGIPAQGPGAVSEALSTSSNPQNLTARRMALSSLVSSNLVASGLARNEVISTLMTCLQESDDPVLVLTAVEGVAKLGEPALAQSALTSVLSRHSAPLSVKIAAVQGLATVGGREGEFLLQSVADDTNCPDAVRSVARKLCQQRR